MSQNDSGANKDDPVNPTEWVNDLTYKEVHLFTEGFYTGLRNLDPRWKRRLQGTVLADSWYAKGGYAIGYLLKVVLVVLAGQGLSGVV